MIACRQLIKLKIHMFGDTSSKMSRAVWFLRGPLSEYQETEVSFMVEKTRVAPLIAMSKLNLNCKPPYWLLVLNKTFKSH